MTHAPEYILALDYGQKRIGVAIAHSIARLPRPLTTLQNGPEIFQEISRLISSEDAGLILVGLPRGMDGSYTEQTRLAEAFCEQLRRAAPVAVELADETLSSVDAETELAGRTHQKADVDALAAAYILERYLREHPNLELRSEV